jgi:hypothetical protein
MDPAAVKSHLNEEMAFLLAWFRRMLPLDLRQGGDDRPAVFPFHCGDF